MKPLTVRDLMPDMAPTLRRDRFRDTGRYRTCPHGVVGPCPACRLSDARAVERGRELARLEGRLREEA